MNSAMRLAACAGLAAVGCAGQVASAQQPAFLALPGGNTYSISYLDVAGLTRSGMDVDARVLNVTAGRQGQPDPVSGQMQKWRVSCDWNSIGIVELAALNADGDMRAPAKVKVTMNFALPDTPAAQLVQSICDPQSLTQAPRFASVKDALAEAKKVIVPIDPSIPQVRPAPSKEETAPPTIVNQPDLKKKEFGAVRVEMATGYALYLDWPTSRRRTASCRRSPLNSLRVTLRTSSIAG